jgi:hypothetical protein
MNQRTFSVLFLMMTACFSVSAQVFPSWNAALMQNGHRGAVIALCFDDEERLLSVGADGFLEIWDIERKTATERFQISRYPISAMALRPGTSQIGIVDRDANGVYRISVWDYVAKKKYFTQSFLEPIASIAYAAGGSFIIAARGSMTGLLFIQAETGESLSAPDVKGAVNLVATGKSERSMVSYLASGTLSYWDLRSRNEIQRFMVQSHLQSPILFGNNRFLAGIETDASGNSAALLLIDAVSGVTLSRRTVHARSGILLPITPELTECVYLAYNTFNTIIYHIAISSVGELEVKNQWQVPLLQVITSIAVITEGVALGTADGAVWLGYQSGAIDLMRVGSSQSIAELAASSSTLGILTQQSADESAQLGFIPLDYRTLTQGTAVPFEYVSHTAIAGGLGEAFLLWQGNTATAPLIRKGLNSVRVERLSRFPLRKAVIRKEKALFLDSAGTITVLSITNGKVLFTFSAIASLDVAFLTDDVILIGRSAVSGNTPFLLVDTITGETVPLAFPAASVGLRVYGGASGSAYGAALEQRSGVPGAVNTVLLQLNTGNPMQSSKFFEISGEGTGFDMAETDLIFASTLGEDGIFGYGSSGSLPFERSPGLPTQLISVEHYFISVDTDGNIAWHEPNTGALLALFHLSGNEWTLQTPMGALHGPIEKKR